jgi:hypothetical protein
MDSQVGITPTQQDDFSPAETTNEKQLDRIADEMAKRGETREQRYDRDHDIFTK